VKMEVILIAAMAKNRVIGKNNRLPWSIPEDLKHFRATTAGHPVIMGRKTFESVGARPLPKRLNIVLSRSMTTPHDAHFTVCDNLQSAINIAKRADEKIFIIGGSKIYQEAIEGGIGTKIILSELKKEYEGDTFFPDFDKKIWKETSRDEFEEFNIVTYERS